MIVMINEHPWLGNNEAKTYLAIKVDFLHIAVLSTDHRKYNIPSALDDY